MFIQDGLDLVDLDGADLMSTNPKKTDLRKELHPTSCVSSSPRVTTRGTAALCWTDVAMLQTQTLLVLQPLILFPFLISSVCLDLSAYTLYLPQATYLTH